jgi:ribosomal protein L20
MQSRENVLRCIFYKTKDGRQSKNVARLLWIERDYLEEFSTCKIFSTS